MGVVASQFLVEPVGGEVPGPPPYQVTSRHGGGRKERHEGDKGKIYFCSLGVSLSQWLAGARVPSRTREGCFYFPLFWLQYNSSFKCFNVLVFTYLYLSYFPWKVL